MEPGPSRVWADGRASSGGWIPHEEEEAGGTLRPGLPGGLSCSHWQAVLDAAPLPRAMTRAPRGLWLVSLMDGGSSSSVSWGPAPGPRPRGLQTTSAVVPIGVWV